jgi:hypothetical protein
MEDFMFNIRMSLSLIVLLFLQGCFYPSYTKKLETPIEIHTGKGFVSKFEDTSLNDKYSSIGDELFWVGVYVVEGNLHPKLRAPTGDNFPRNSKWKGTHIYNDGESGDLIVVTSTDYYHENIGVILDSDEHVATNFSVIDVGNGKKHGRRWAMEGSGNFFNYSDKITEYWGLRYSGIKDNFYSFDIINKYNSNVTEVIQSIQISEDNFLDGIVIRGVLIRGIEKENRGIIHYQLYDKLKDVTKRNN